MLHVFCVLLIPIFHWSYFSIPSLNQQHRWISDRQCRNAGHAKLWGNAATAGTAPSRMQTTLSVCFGSGRSEVFNVSCLFS